jgi:mono/diheme cytochrome c family protein
LSRAVRAAALLAALLAGPPAAAESPEILYMLHCQGCHLPDGSGVPGAVPSLASLARLLAVPEGRAFLVQVPGSASSALSDAELGAVLDWMIRRFAPGAGPVPAYGPEEVARWRAAPLSDVASVRRRILELGGSP